MNQLRVAGLFAGIGGLELGLSAAGHETVALCEIDEAARAVLGVNFPDIPLELDVRTIERLPEHDVLAAGFPCQDLSQAGRKAGIRGQQSSLVDHVFRLAQRQQPEWIVIENVSYMLRLDRGRAMAHLVSSLDDLGYRWAYRVVDARAFGVPQRRQRVILVASRHGDPGSVLFADDAPEVEFEDQVGPVDVGALYGFYWTEGLRGLGWAKEAVPTVKGGSRLGIPSPPAIWVPRTGEIGTPSLEDAERLQGFAAGWTAPAADAGLPRARWNLVGNAVCVPMAAWVGERIAGPGAALDLPTRPFHTGDRWPAAACGHAGERHAVDAALTPHAEPYRLASFLDDPLHPLSRRASAGFLSRARRGRLRFAEGFLRDMEMHVDLMTDTQQRLELV